MKYSLYKLQVIEEILSEGSMNKAAKRLGTSQSALSRSLLSLEESLGFNIFYRKKNQLILSNEGAALIKEMRKLLVRAEKFDESVELIKRGLKELRIGTPTGLAFRFMPEVIVQYGRTNEGSEIRLEMRSSPALCNEINNGDLDVSIVSKLSDMSSMVVSKEIISADLVCVVSNNSPLANYSNLSIEDIRQENIIFPSSFELAGGWVNDENKSLFANARVTANIASICGIVSQGGGVSVLNVLSAFEMIDSERVKIIPFTPVVKFKFYLTYRLDWAENHDIQSIKDAIKVSVENRKQQMGELRSLLAYIG